MSYFLERDGATHGPYSLEELRQFQAQGRIGETDRLRLQDGWQSVPWREVLEGATAFGELAKQQQRPVVDGPMPPDVKWWVVFLVGLLCNLAPLAWLFVQANFVRKIDNRTNPVLTLCVATAIGFVGLIALAAADGSGDFSALVMGLSAVLLATSAGLYFFNLFRMRRAIHEYYNHVEPMGVELTGFGSGVLTVLFPAYYFQYHLADIAERKKSKLSIL